MKSRLAIIPTLLAGALPLDAQLPVHEPFDYPPVNDPIAGRLDGKNGGSGFGGPWQDSSGDHLGLAFVYDHRGNPDASTRRIERNTFMLEDAARAVQHAQSIWSRGSFRLGAASRLPTHVFSPLRFD
jgi:hypothetical protein